MKEKAKVKKKTALKVQFFSALEKKEGPRGWSEKKTWCIGNFLVGDTSSLDEARKQKFRRDESKKYFLFCKRLLDCNALLKLSWCIECMKRSQMVIAVKTLKVKKIGQISDDAFEDIIQSDFFMYLPFKIAKMGVQQSKTLLHDSPICSYSRALLRTCAIMHICIPSFVPSFLRSPFVCEGTFARCSSREKLVEQFRARDKSSKLI